MVFLWNQQEIYFGKQPESDPTTRKTGRDPEPDPSGHDAGGAEGEEDAAKLRREEAHLSCASVPVLCLKWGSPFFLRFSRVACQHSFMPVEWLVK